MFSVVSTQTMRKIDAQAINGDVEVGFTYMKRASHALASEVEMLANILGTRDVVIFCGKGNNGGDGLYLGKILLDLTYSISCYMTVLPSDLTGEALLAYQAFLKSGGEVTVLDEETDFSTLNRGITVDALLGTGVTGTPRGMVKKCIHYINTLTDFIFSVDNPSGFDADSGEPSEVCVEADMTVSLGYPKVGHYFADPRIIGQLCVHELDYPAELLRKNPPLAQVTSKESVKQLFPRRHYYGSKYDHGVVVTCAGSRGMTGAPTLAAMGVLRSGAGMAYVVTPQSLIPSLSSNIIEPVMVAAPETDEGSLALQAIEIVDSLKEKMDVLLIGPGLSRNSETAEVVREVVSEAEVPVILDGDGLNAFIAHKDIFKSVDNLLITPHYGEWKRLFGNLPDNAMDRLNRLSEVALEHGLYILFKGMPTILVNPEGEIKFSTFGNSGLATAGSGDVLAGIIASLVSQGLTLEAAAHVGVALHGKAGDLAINDLNEYSLIASDIITYLPQAINAILM